MSTTHGAMNPFAMPFIPLASLQSSFAMLRTERPCSTVRAERHEDQDSISFRDQTSCPTALASNPSVGQSVSSQFNIETSENIPQGLESGRNTEEGSSINGNKIIKRTSSKVRRGRVPEPPNVPQAHRMSGEKIASDTNNDAFQGNGSQLISTEDVPEPESRSLGPYPYFIHPVVPPRSYGRGHSIHPQPPFLPVLPPPPPPPGPCFPMLHIVPCQIMDVSTGRPFPDRYTFAFQVTYRLLPDFAMPGPSFQTRDQNPTPIREEMNTRAHGRPALESQHLTLLAQEVNASDAMDETQSSSSSLDRLRVVERGSQYLVERSSNNSFDAEAGPPTVRQGCTEETKLLSAVDSPKIGEENNQTGQQLLQQDCHLLFSSQHHRNTADESAQSSQVSERPGQSQTPAEAASWSQSKRWLSSETKERRAFQKMMLNLQFMKADQSPFIPKTPAELTKFKISLAEARQQKLAHEVSILEERTRQKELAKASGLATFSKPQVTLFNGRDMGDRLSPVFAAQNCFNKQDIAEVNSRVEWPSLAELKEEGDRRTRCGRYLPLPRTNVAFKISDGEQEHAYKPDGTIL
ncbi:hypothetical protein V8C35DRAFT_278248 [Trichoderma chlorosporum]